MRAVATEILDAVVPLGECEAIEAIASRLPAIVIGDLLGYPRELWERVRLWSEQLMLLAGQTSPDGPPHVTHPGIPPVIQEYTAVTTELIDARRAEPRDDLISLWANTDGWETGHVLEEALLVLDGGAETTRTVIGTMIRELALQPEQRQLLLDRPELLETTAVEEFIRWVTPVLNMRRTVTTDHELHGQHLQEGDELLLLYGAANRDPRVFDVIPNVLDVTRARQPAPRVRLRHALLPRRVAGPARDPGDVRGAAPADPRLGAGRPRRAPRHAGDLRPRLRPDPHPVR